MTTTPARPNGKQYGVVSAEQRSAVSGLEFVQALVAGALPMNTMARTLGYRIVEAENGRVVVAARPSEEHPEGVVHGGLAATLLDTCMGLAVRSTLEKGVAATTFKLKVSLLRAVTPQTGEVRAEGTVLSRGRRVRTAEGRLDRDGRLLAHGTATCLVFDH